MNIILIGFMGCGKSTIAKKLSSILKWPILEMDEWVLKETGAKSMHEVFVKGGEYLLRETEIEIAKKNASIQKTIISTGGGAVLNPLIFDYFKSHDGKIFFLKTAFDTITSRLELDTSRPLFKNMAEAKALYHFRHPLYLKAADHVIEVYRKSADEIAEEIAKNVRPLYGE